MLVSHGAYKGPNQLKRTGKQLGSKLLAKSHNGLHFTDPFYLPEKENNTKKQVAPDESFHRPSYANE